MTEAEEYLISQGFHPHNLITNHKGERKLVAGVMIKYAEQQKDKTEVTKEQLSIGGVNKLFNSEEELLQFIYLNTPIAIKPKSKRAKRQLVSPFKSVNAFEQVCKHLAKNLFNVC